MSFDTLSLCLHFQGSAWSLYCLVLIHPQLGYRVCMQHRTEGEQSHRETLAHLEGHFPLISQSGAFVYKLT